MNINIVQVAKIVGTAMSIGGALLTGWAGQKTTTDTIMKQVAKAVAEQTKLH